MALTRMIVLAAWTFGLLMPMAGAIRCLGYSLLLMATTPATGLPLLLPPPPAIRKFPTHEKNMLGPDSDCETALTGLRD